MILNEKGDQAKTFAKILGGKSGFLPNGDSYDIVHSSGHLLKFKKPQDNVSEEVASKYNDWKNLSSYPWNIHDFKWQYELNPSGNPPSIKHTQKLLKTIKETSVGQDAIVIATDDDPSGEGDVLAWEIINYIGWKGKVFRIRFDSETKESVTKSLKSMTNAREGKDQCIYHAGIARQIFDYLSQQLSPIATINARNEGYSTDALRLGRLKSVINMVVWYQNYLRAHYVKKPFYEVRYKDENGNIFKRQLNDGDPGRFSEEDLGKKDLTNYNSSSIEIVKEEEKRQQPPALLSYSDLNVLVSKEGFSDSQFDNVYEQMYIKGLVSYPRTEDTKIDQELFDQLLPLADKIAKLVGVDPKLLTFRKLRKKHYKKHTDHGANRPGTTVPNSLQAIKDEYGAIGVSIYTHLAKSFLSILCEDYIYKQTQAKLSSYPEFTSTINTPINLNYKLVFDEKELDDTDDKKEESSKSFSSLANPFLYKGSNTPPAKPTKSFVNNFLKKNGLGTGATRVSAFKTLSEGNKSTMKLTRKDGYVLNYNGTLSALITRHAGIANVKVTKTLQDYLTLVKQNKIDWKQIPPLMSKIVVHDMPIIQNNAKELHLDKQLSYLAAKANPSYEKKDKVEGTWLGKSVKIAKTWGSHEFTSEELQNLFENKEIEFLAKKKNGETYMAKGKLQNQEVSIIKNGRKTTIKYVGFALTPKELKEDKNHFVGIWKHKKVRVWNRYGDHIFSKEEQEKLLHDQEIEFSGISKKTNKTYTVKGKLGIQVRKGYKNVIFKAKFK